MLFLAGQDGEVGIRQALTGGSVVDVREAGIWLVENKHAAPWVGASCMPPF